MKVGIAGSRVREVREAFGLNGRELARVLSVNPVTLYRWEGSRSGVVTIDGMPGDVMCVLSRRVGSSGFDAMWWGAKVRDALRSSGTLKALSVLIDACMC